MPERRTKRCRGSTGPYQVVKHIIIRPKTRLSQTSQHSRPILKVYHAPVGRFPPHGVYPPTQPIRAVVERHARGRRQPARQVVGGGEAGHTAAHDSDVLWRRGGVVPARVQRHRDAAAVRRISWSEASG